MRSRRLTTLASVEGFEQRLGGCCCGPGPIQLAGRLGCAQSGVSGARPPQAWTAGAAVLLSLRLAQLLPTCAVLELPVLWRRSTRRDIPTQKQKRDVSVKELKTSLFSPPNRWNCYFPLKPAGTT
jgi:hypothetical protein